MEGRYQAKPFPNTTLQEVEASANTENFKMEEKPENGNRKINRIEGSFPGFRKNLYEYWVEYSSYTGIQGIRYIGEPRRPVFERITWLLCFCVSLYMCIYLIIQAYNKWDTSPVLVSFATSPTPIWKIPFPAITICPELKAVPSIYNFTENKRRMRYDFENMTDAEVNMFHNMELVCNNPFDLGFNLTIGYDAIEFLKKVAPSLSGWACKNPFRKQCKEIFTPTLTEEGICYTFNMLDRSEVYKDNVYVYGDFMSHKERSGEWTLEGGYPKNVPIDTYPRRSLSAGIHSKFHISILSSKRNVDYSCSGPRAQGYKIILHHPDETPQLGMHYYLAPHMQNMNFAIKPDMITTSDSLRSYDPHRRGCYFPEERNLTFFRSYTQQNCELECLTNFTLAKCKCVAFHMPHELKTPICGTKRKYCILNAQDDLVRKEVEASINEEDLGVSGPSHCNCLPGCTSLVYNTEISQTGISEDQSIPIFFSDYHLLKSNQLTELNMYFKEQQFITSERNELYSQTDFLANCGGLLGLFTGFSFLSLVEIFYFLSLRLYGNVKKYGRQYWSGSQELVNNDKYDHQQ